MENEQGFTVGLTKIAKWAGMALAVLALMAWVAGYAAFSANYPGVWQARKYYNERVLERKSLPDELPYVAQVRERGEGGYTYELWGKIETLDYAGYLMTLKDKRGQEWRVRLVQAPYYQRDRIGIKLHEFTINRESGMGMGGRAVPLTIDRRAPELTEPYLQAGDMISAVWNDPLVLSEIYRRNRRGEYTVELTGEIPRPIRKVVGK